MLSNYVLPGDKLELTIVKNNAEEQNKEEKKVYKTKIYDVVSDDELKVTMPMEKGKLILLAVDTEYDLCIYTQDGLYQCYARVTDRYKSNNVYILSMELTSSLKKFQRREYYRLNCVLNMKCKSLTGEEQTHLEQKVEFMDTDFTLQDGVIVDISGGGARFISTEKYDVGTKILFLFCLTVSEAAMQYNVIGRVLLSEEIDGREGEYENRVQFLDLNNDDREGIIKFIFEEERKIRRREKS